MDQPCVLGIVPARSGSKGIPHKNLALLGGQPLLAFTAATAARSRRLSRCILTTDGEEIAAVGAAHGLEVPFRRPASLAGDDTPTLAVVQHALAWLQDHEGYRPDLVVLLQPTSPLRRAVHVDRAVDLLLETGAHSVVSVCRLEHPVQWLRRLDNAGRVLPFVSGPEVTHRQAAGPCYRLNGAVYVTRTEILAAGSLVGQDTRALVMNPEDSVDIDTPSDLLYAQFLLEHQADPGGGMRT